MIQMNTLSHFCLNLVFRIITSYCTTPTYDSAPWNESIDKKCNQKYIMRDDTLVGSLPTIMLLKPIVLLPIEWNTSSTIMLCYCRPTVAIVRSEGTWSYYAISRWSRLLGLQSLYKWLVWESWIHNLGSSPSWPYSLFHNVSHTKMDCSNLLQNMMLHLNAFRGELATSLFGWHVTTILYSSHDFAISTSWDESLNVGIDHERVFESRITSIHNGYFNSPAHSSTGTRW